MHCNKPKCRRSCSFGLEKPEGLGGDELVVRPSILKFSVAALERFSSIEVLGAPYPQSDA
jgi:hypothetical protein